MMTTAVATSSITAAKKQGAAACGLKLRGVPAFLTQWGPGRTWFRALPA